MYKVNPQDPPKPCEYFDMMGGTSTGGLIAIMLGRLEMSIAECREAYATLSRKAFTPVKKYAAGPGWFGLLPWNWVIQARFDTMALELGIKQLVRDVLKRDPSNATKTDEELDATLLRSIQSKCQVFVTTVNKRFPDRPAVFATYESRYRDMLDHVTIWQAARATSAAPTFFDPVFIGPPDMKEAFQDGGTGANNPINYLWNQAKDFWQPKGALEAEIQCLVSIGTGEPPLVPFGDSLVEVFATLKNMATDTETTAETFRVAHNSDLVSSQRYFRFNVRRGLENVGLEEAAELGTINSATRRYLAGDEDRDRLLRCADNLRHRECMPNFA
ncbi:hypothetical protein E8E11_000639 [Didymella keratinophila]|nr:hypothetical protein E8E11_000639 [Didymella keratinophila]